MAKQVLTRLIDDLDGGDAEETVSFAFDGNSYEIDLSGSNAAEFRKLMDRYLHAGTRIGRFGANAQLIPTRPTRGSAAASSTLNREMNTKIREWAARNGFQVSERGRIPTHVVDAFHDAGGRDHTARDVQLALETEKVHTTETPEPEPEQPKKTARPRKAAPATFRSAAGKK